MTKPSQNSGFSRFKCGWLTDSYMTATLQLLGAVLTLPTCSSYFAVRLDSVLVSWTCRVLFNAAAKCYIWFVPTFIERDPNRFGTFNRQCLQSIWQGGRKVSIHVLNIMRTVVCWFLLLWSGHDFRSWLAEVKGIRYPHFPLGWISTTTCMCGCFPKVQSINIYIYRYRYRLFMHLPSRSHLDRSNYTPSTISIDEVDKSFSIAFASAQASWTAWVVWARRWGLAGRSWGASLDWSMLWGGCWCAFPSTTHVPGQQGDRNGRPFMFGKGWKELPSVKVLSKTGKTCCLSKW